MHWPKSFFLTLALGTMIGASMDVDLPRPEQLQQAEPCITLDTRPEGHVLVTGGLPVMSLQELCLRHVHACVRDLGRLAAVVAPLHVPAWMREAVMVPSATCDICSTIMFSWYVLMFLHPYIDGYRYN